MSKDWNCDCNTDKFVFHENDCPLTPIYAQTCINLFSPTWWGNLGGNNYLANWRPSA